MGCQERWFPAAAGDGGDYGEEHGRAEPEATAVLIGGPLAPGSAGWSVLGRAGRWKFCPRGGLPVSTGPGRPAALGPFGFHIHENGDCTVGDPANPFTAAGPHWNRITSPTEPCRRSPGPLLQLWPGDHDLLHQQVQSGRDRGTVRNHP